MPELLVIPLPLTVKSALVAVVMVKGLAPELNTIPLTSVKLKICCEILVVLETPNVATSAGPSGTVAGVQFAAVFQSPLVGFKFQAALPAWTLAARTRNKKARPQSRARRNDRTGFIRVFIDLVPFWGSAQPR